MVRAQALEVIMSMYESIGTASANVVYRVMKALVAGLELEFGRGAGKALAGRFLEAEEVDFRWEARVEERWLGAYDSIDDEDVERSEEHTSELQSLMSNSYAVFCLKKKKKN